MYVRRLGGSLVLQGIALLLALTMPLILGTWLFQTVVFDQLTWMLSLYWFLSLIVTRKARYWILLGITLGFGLETKDTILALIAGMGVAVLATPSLRMMLRTKYPWYGAALMVVIWAPNIIWQIVNGFPSLTYASNHGGTIAGGGGIAAYLGGLILILNLLIPLWIAGAISLFRNKDLRPVGIAIAVPLVAFLFVGKYYYAGPTIPLVLAQGLIAISHLDRRRTQIRAHRERCCRNGSRRRGAPEVRASDHAFRSPACHRPRQRGGLRRHGRLAADHQPGDRDLRGAPGVRAQCHGDHLE